MTALPADPPPIELTLTGSDLDAQYPTRPRSSLVPLADDYLDDPWFLSAMGIEAHRPAARVNLSQLLSHDSLAFERSACGVYITPTPAGPDVRRCPVCEQTVITRENTMT